MHSVRLHSPTAGSTGPISTATTGPIILFLALATSLLAACSGNTSPAHDAFNAYNIMGGAHRANDYSRFNAPAVDGLMPVQFPSVKGGFLAPPLELPLGRLGLLARNDSAATLLVVFRDSILWRYRFPADQHPMPLMAADSAGILYAVTSRGLLKAFSSEGKILWEKQIPRDTAGFAIPSPLLALSDGVVVGSSSGRISRFDRNGEQLWSVARGASLSDLFAGDPGLGLALGATHNNYESSDTLLLLDPATGAERWARPVDGARIVEGPALVGDLIIVGVVRLGDDELRQPSLAAYTRTGSLAWQAPLPLTPRGIAGDEAGNIYISTSGVGTETIGGAVLSFDRAGKKRWEVTLESGVPAPPAVSAEWIYFVARREGRTGVFTYGRDGRFRNFLSIHVYPDVLAQITVSSFGEVLLAGMDVAAVLRGG